jgi:hypothetical protein
MVTNKRKTYRDRCESDCYTGEFSDVKDLIIAAETRL